MTSSWQKVPQKTIDVVTYPCPNMKQTQWKWHHDMMTSSNGNIFRVTGPHKGQWRGALMFSLICAWTNGKANNRDASALSRHRAHYDVTVIKNYPRQVSIIYMISYSSKSLLICEIYVIHINERSYHVGFRGFPLHEGFSEERDINKKKGWKKVTLSRLFQTRTKSLN